MTKQYFLTANTTTTHWSLERQMREKAEEAFIMIFGVKLEQDVSCVEE